MRTAPTGHPASTYQYRKAAGDEPLPGYRLLAPLGHGGFGEVWECEAPGGLHKAVKFVFDDRHDMACITGDNSLQQEFEAVEHVKRIRHPFLLTMERVERTGALLVIVMELADRNLQDRFDECKAEGLAGIPRDELLAYLADAAEALDLIAGGHGLQHLDVKPANLFLVGSHAKVGDYGLVRPQAAGKGSLSRGLTPKYVAPEVVNGQVESSSDQYSLALVYQELLTGTFPYPGGNAQQLLIQHATAEPDVSGLPPGDRPAIRRALSKDPAGRFPSCVALVEALMTPTGVLSTSETWRAGTAGPSLILRRARLSRAAGLGQASSDTLPIPGPRSDVEDTAWPPGLVPTPGPVGRTGLPEAETAPVGACVPTPAGPLPPLTGPPRLVTPKPADARKAPPSEPIVLKVASPPPPPAPCVVIRLGRIHAVEPVSLLKGGKREGGPLPKATDLAAAVARAAAAEHPTPANPGELVRLAGGAWTCRFPVRTGGGMIPHKLAALTGQWHAELSWPDPATALFRRAQNPGLLKMLAGRASGLEVTVHLPPDAVGVGEVVVIGRPTGGTDSGFAQTASRMLQSMVDDVKKLIQNQTDRRGSVRVPAAFAMEVYPVSGVGEVMPAMAAKCRDVSAGGICFETAEPVPTSYVYATFAGVRAVAGWAILTKLVRNRPEGPAHVAGGRFRTDL